MAETTPLIGGRRNARHHQQQQQQQQQHRTDDGQPRRRNLPQHLQTGDVQGFSRGHHDNGFDKADRRTVFGRLTSFVSGVFYNSHNKSISGAYGDPLFYEDDFNDQSWLCTFGTSDNDGIWLNYNDQVGTIMSTMVWVLILYSCLTITLLAQNNHLRNRVAMTYCTICALALASHAKTTLTDPGSIPKDAVPRAALFKQGITTHAMCSHCQTYKPPHSHHCRICNRCISRMDHHCPWMNNCVGAGNFKHFILFLCYTWTGCAFALIIFGGNYFLCSSEDCTFSSVLIQLVRVMTLLCIVTLLFTSSMLMNVTYGIMTGIGTIDRLKKKADDTLYSSEEEPMELEDIFGIGGYWTWLIPIDPVFPDYDQVMGYSIPQRLIRERERDAASGNKRSSYDQV